MAEAFAELALKSIDESPTNPRQHFAADALAELTESVRAHGVLSPVLVRPRGKRFEIVAGARRFRAAQAAGLKTIPAAVRELDDKAVLEVQVVENLQRADLSPMEEARGYQLLHERHGYAVEELAGKVGKSKAYVYARMKLCALPAGAQKLLEEGQLDVSRALLVARIPVVELAEKAARQIAWGQWLGESETLHHDEVPEPMSYRAASEFVQDEYMLRLDEAPFATSDAALVPAAGACGACPKRTGNQQDLFGDVPRADVCTDPVCYRSKVDAWFAQRAAEVEAKGGTVLAGKAAERMRHGGKLVRLDERCYDDEPKHRTWRKLLGKAVQELPITLLRDDDGHVEERVERAVAVKAARAAGKLVARSASTTNPDSQVAKKKKQHQTRLAAVRLVHDELLAAIAGVPVDAVLRYVVEEVAFRHHESAKKVFARLGVEEIGDRRLGYDQRRERERDLRRAALGTCDLGRLAAIAVELIAFDRPSANWADGYSEHWLAACELVGLDMKAAEKRVAKAKPATAPAKGKRGRAKPDEDLELEEEERSCRECGCTERNACAGGCSWVEDDLCSACAEECGDEPQPASTKKRGRKAKEASHG